MDTAASQLNPHVVRLHRILAKSWAILRHPNTTIILIVALLLVFIFSQWLPQRAAPEITAAVWIDSLPAAIQPWGNLLFLLGLSRISTSLWFWGPLALLLLNSLLALADYLPTSWHRFRQQPASLAWQHPLAHRVEHSVRLPATPDDLLEAHTASLAQSGFAVTDLPQENDRALSAARRGWSWLLPIVIYAGVLLLVAALLLSHYSFKTETLTIWPDRPASSQLFQSNVELYQVVDGRATVIFNPTDEQEPPLALFLQPNRPNFFKQVFIWTTAIEPVLTVEARDSGGEQRRLMPVQANLPPGTRLSLPLDQPDTPLYFLIPSANLAFQMVPAAAHGSYQVQVRRGGDEPSTESLTAQIGEPLQVDDISLQFSRQNNIQFIARRDFGLPLLVISLLLMAAGALLLALLPPWQVWLIPEVKGRGGQLYGVAEKIGPAQPALDFLERLLNADPPSPTDTSQPSSPQQ